MISRVRLAYVSLKKKCSAVCVGSIYRVKSRSKNKAKYENSGTNIYIKKIYFQSLKSKRSSGILW